MLTVYSVVKCGQPSPRWTTALAALHTYLISFAAVDLGIEAYWHATTILGARLIPQCRKRGSMGVLHLTLGSNMQGVGQHSGRQYHVLLSAHNGTYCA